MTLPPGACCSSESRYAAACDRNWRSSTGELDLVVRDEATLPALRQLRRRLKAVHERSYRRLGLDPATRLRWW